MNLGSDAAFDLAAERAEQERDAGIASARAALKGAGRADCIECGHPIPQARRLAHPAAARCVECQNSTEGRRDRR